MDFSWTDEQRQRRADAVAFAEDKLNDDLVQRNRDGEWSWDAWRAAADFGILGLATPQEYGGSGLDLLSTVFIMEGVGYGCREVGLPYALNAHMWSVQQALLKFGTDEQRHTYLTPLVKGEKLGSFGITEPDSGSDSYAMQMKATRVDGGYVLNGTKAHITFAPIADIAVVFASTDPDVGRWGISAFIVETSSEGCDTGEIEKMGLRTAPYGMLYLSDCFVPESNLLGAEGGGVGIFTSAMEAERPLIFSSMIGRMERQIEDSVEYAKNRKAFGTTIGSFQAVSHRIADMMVRLETARNLLYKVAWLEQQGLPLLKEAAMAKLYLSESAVQSSIDAMRIRGAEGYETAHHIERDVRDTMGGLIYSGTSDIQRNIIAGVSGL